MTVDTPGKHPQRTILGQLSFLLLSFFCSAGIPRARGLTTETPTMSPSTILPRNPTISMIALTMVKRKHLTQTGQSTTLSKAPQVLRTAVKGRTRSQDTRRTTTQSQRATTNLDMTAKKNQSLTVITDQTKITSQNARTMSMTMPKIIPAAVDQEQVSRGTNRVADTGKPGTQPRIPAAPAPRMETQMRASTTVPTTTMEVRPEAKKDQGPIMEVQQMATAVTCKTMVAHTTIMSMLQVRRMFTRTQKTMVATKILGIMVIPMKTMESGPIRTIEAPIMTPEAQDLSTRSLKKSTVRVAATIWTATMGLIHGQVKNMG